MGDNDLLTVAIVSDRLASFLEGRNDMTREEERQLALPMLLQSIHDLQAVYESILEG